MDDSNSANPGSSAWLRDEHRMIVYALVSLVFVVSGHRTWQEYHKHAENAARRARILRLVESSRRERERADASVKLGSTDGAGASHRPEGPPPSHELVAGVAPARGTGAGSGAQAQHEDDPTPARITKRSKERRKRGRGVYKAILRQGRKEVRGVVASGTNPPLPPDLLLQEQAASGSGTAGSSSSNSRATSLAGSSRSSSRARSASEYESTEDTPRPKSTDWMIHSTLTEAAPDVPQDSRSDYSSMSDSQSSLGIATRVSSQTSDDHTEREHAHATKPATPPLPESGSSSTSASTSASVSVGAGSPSPASSSNLDLIVEDSESFSTFISQPVPSVPLTKAQPPWLKSVDGSPHSSRIRTYPKTSSSGSVASITVSDSSWESEGQNRRLGSKSPPQPPRFRSLSRASLSPMLNTVALSAASPTSTLPPNASPHAQIATYKDALEASRKREDKYRRELEKFKQECDVLRYRWNEDADRRRRREAELQAQLQQVTSQLQSLSLSVSQMQVQPFLPLPQPGQQPQQPMHGGFPPYPPLPFVYPAPGYNSSGTGSLPLPSHPLSLSYPFLSTLPHMTPRNGSISNMASPAREYGAPGSGFGTFDVAGANDVVGGYDVDVNTELAEAILKRPESIRSPSSASALSPSGSTSGSGSGSRSASVAGRATRDGFTFASLSELGNPQPRRSETKDWTPCAAGRADYDGENVHELHGEGGAENAHGDAMRSTSHAAGSDALRGEERESVDDGLCEDCGPFERASESHAPEDVDVGDGCEDRPLGDADADRHDGRWECGRQ